MTLNFTLTRTDPATDAEQELDVTAVPVDAPDREVGLSNWAFEITALDADGALVILTQRETDIAADTAAEMLRKERHHR